MDDAASRAPEIVEAERLRALRSLHALDSGSDRRFDRIVRTAALLFRAPKAALVLVDRDRIWFKARIGIPKGQYPREGSLSDRIIRAPETLILPDRLKDPRFAKLKPPADLEPRFFACAPLIAPSGEAIGLLVAADPEPHEAHTDAERLALEDLASLAVETLVHDAETIEAERRARLDHQRVELALEAAGLGEFEWDLVEDQVFVSDRMMSLMGIDQSTAPAKRGEVVYSHVHPDDVPQLRERLEAGLKEGRYHVQYRLIRPDDGRLRWMEGAGVMIHDRAGAPQRVVGIVRDVTEARAEAEHREVLLAELDHRVKNVLAAVQALATQSARRTRSTDGFLSAFSGRLKAMASAHELLTATRWRGAGLTHIATAELGGLAPGQARWSGPELILTPRAANAVSLALHELATNAVKYGALSSESGRVEVAWGRTPDGGFRLDWTERGGPAVKTPERRGFGSTLLERVTSRELGGECRVEYPPDGVHAWLQADFRTITAAPPRDGPETGEAATPDEGASRGPPPVDDGEIGGLKVLIVEDAVLLALELEAGLQEAGAEVVAMASELEEALQLLDRPIDAAVLDANLNGESVRPLAEILRDRGTPFVFATGYGERGAPEGFDAPVVRKPYNVRQIVQALARATGR
ncbi:HWE histidine kinase domain-containing protein [Caulobacter mirabilis]|uniref:histidine kinase n=1 Tax=Caulobacter mirabilis TaxID=69666 RepID=A0A2D2ASG3_9CAUL|nr:HWE histidine kinase domain-containing protein [Caulobacter mirabilis]ATQ40950.1 hypothetical protein CSW64_00265 [Caulobacter mirabilis]